MASPTTPPGAVVTIAGNVYGANNITQIYFNGTIINQTDCTLETCSLQIANFEYLPNAAGNYFFIVLFALLLLFNVPIGIWRRTWGVLVGMFFGLALEAVGYGGRIMARSNPFAFNPFLIYIVCLTIAPAFISAAIYLCLARIIVVYGEGNSRFKPRTYSITFMVSDFIALVLQGAGGGIAATAAGNNESQAQDGINIMIAGLAWQVASILLFALACVDFTWRVRQGKGLTNPSFLDLRNSAKWTSFLWGLGIATLAVFIRSVYRVAELAQGFGGDIANEEVPFMIFEGAMISIAAIALTVFHPGLIFGRRWAEANFKLNGKIQRQDIEMKGQWQDISGPSSMGASREEGLIASRG